MGRRCWAFAHHRVVARVGLAGRLALAWLRSPLMISTGRSLSFNNTNADYPVAMTFPGSPNSWMSFASRAKHWCLVSTKPWREVLEIGLMTNPTKVNNCF